MKSIVFALLIPCGSIPSALAGTLMAMGRCKQRYHRALFLGWLLPAVGVLNVMLIFIAIWPADELAELKKSTNCPTLGFSRCVCSLLSPFAHATLTTLTAAALALAALTAAALALAALTAASTALAALAALTAAAIVLPLSRHAGFQQQLGEALIEYGIDGAKDELGTAEERAEQGLSPGFMPQVEQRQATGFEPYTFPVNHKEIAVPRTMTTAELHRKGVTTNMRCARCYAVAVRDGETTWRHGDGKGGPRYVDGDNVPQSVRKMPNGDNVPALRARCVCARHAFRWSWMMGSHILVHGITRLSPCVLAAL